MDYPYEHLLCRSPETFTTLLFLNRRFFGFSKSGFHRIMFYDVIYSLRCHHKFAWFKSEQLSFVKLAFSIIIIGAKLQGFIVITEDGQMTELSNVVTRIMNELPKHVLT